MGISSATARPSRTIRTAECPFCTRSSNCSSEVVPASTKSKPAMQPIIARGRGERQWREAHITRVNLQRRAACRSLLVAFRHEVEAVSLAELLAGHVNDLLHVPAKMRNAVEDRAQQR